MYAQLLEHLATNQIVSITRGVEDHPTWPGYLLGLSKELALFHLFHDFHPDGYQILRVNQVDEVTRDESEFH